MDRIMLGHSVDAGGRWVVSEQPGVALQRRIDVLPRQDRCLWTT
jgi:hypothetical protein